MVNSMIPWIGGKRLMREFLIARFPPHYDKYVEVFGGAGWVLLAKKPAHELCKRAWFFAAEQQS